MKKKLIWSLFVITCLVSGYQFVRAQSNVGRNVIWYVDFDHVSFSCDTQSYNVPGWRIIPTTNADFDGDGKSDILWWQGDATQPNAGAVVIWYMNGCTMRDARYIGALLDVDWKMTTFGDFNGDGKTDILWSYIEQ